MAESKHTPGPWSVGVAYGPLKTEVIAPNEGRAIAAVWTKSVESDRVTGREVMVDSEEGAANARLIAAAPDMLEACRRAISYIERDETAHGREFSEGNILRTAIAKAEGL